MRGIQAVFFPLSIVIAALKSFSDHHSILKSTAKKSILRIDSDEHRVCSAAEENLDRKNKIAS